MKNDHMKKGLFIFVFTQIKSKERKKKKIRYGKKKGEMVCLFKTVYEDKILKIDASHSRLVFLFNQEYAKGLRLLFSHYLWQLKLIWLFFL